MASPTADGETKPDGETLVVADAVADEDCDGEPEAVTTGVGVEARPKAFADVDVADAVAVLDVVLVAVPV